MTADELSKLLKEKGLPVGEWAQTPEKRVALNFMGEDKKKTLESVAKLLEAQIEEEKKKLADALAQKSRLTSGGGQ